MADILEASSFPLLLSFQLIYQDQYVFNKCSFFIKEKFLLRSQWPQMFLPAFNGTKSVELKLFQFFMTFNTLKSQLSLTQNKIP